MTHLPEMIASRETLESGDFSPEAKTADLADIRARWAEQARPPHHKNTNWWRYAAAAVLLGFVAWSIMGYQDSQRPNQVFAQYFDAPAELEYFSLRSNENTAALQPLDNLLKEARYDDALALSRQLTKADPFATRALLYEALAAMALREYPTAARALDQALALEMPTADRISARWYRGMVHLAQDEPEAARTELEWVVANSQGQSKNKAAQVLEGM